jgi:long-chain acyl-CoA synthetase
MGFPDLLSATAARLPAKTAIIFRDQRLSYAEIEQRSRQCAAELVARGVRSGDRVVLLAPNQPEWLIALFGILGAGAVVVPVNPALTTGEIAFIVQNSEARLAMVDPALSSSIAGAATDIVPLSSVTHTTAKPLPSWVARNDDDPAIIFYTSGTTGRPKGAVLSHSANMSTAIRVGHVWGMTERDCHLLAGSLSFIYNSIINAGSAFAVGGTVVLQERFHPGEALAAVQAYKISVLMSVPTMYVMMAEWASAHSVDASSVRVAISAGAALAPSVMQRARERLGIELLDGWGMTEGTPITGYDVREFRSGRPESAGRPLPKCEVRILDDRGREVGVGEIGELVFRSPSNMTEYYKAPEATAEVLRDGWMHSGDLARRDDDGFVYIAGRKKDMIIRGGANIYPAEIEEILYGLDGVAECAVIGIPDDLYGETVKAVVVRAAGSAITAPEILAHCRNRLAEYKLPTQIEFVDALPKGPTGKILKRLLVRNPANVS